MYHCKIPIQLLPHDLKKICKKGSLVSKNILVIRIKICSCTSDSFDGTNILLVSDHGV